MNSIRVRRMFDRIAIGRLSIFGQLWQFLRMRKRWWLLPLLIIILLLSLLLVFAQGSALAPLIYTVF
ncbi:hypothetical protein HYW84_02250 [Candidatus Peregrinibacteria bacterium]|nr:hypothetical protein [Candidatus Peregrinibacteria bacterium]